MPRLRPAPRLVALAVLLLALLGPGCADPESRREAFYKEALALHEAGNNEDARLAVKNALQIDAKFAQGYVLLGDISLGLKRWKQAYEAYGKASALDPGLSAAKAGQARILLLANRLDMAQALVDDLLAQVPPEPEALLLQAAIDTREGRTDAARRQLHEVIDKTPKNAEAYLMLGALLQQGGEAGAALAVLRLGAQALPDAKAIGIALSQALAGADHAAEAEARLLDLITRFPQDTLFEGLLAKLLVEHGAADRAFARLDGLIARDTANEEYRLLLADAAMAAGQPARAEAGLREALRSSGEAYALRDRLVDILRSQGKLDEALRALHEGIALAPGHPKAADAWKAVAEIGIQQRDPRAALDAARAALERSPGDPQARLLAGQALLLQGDPRGAISELRQAVDKTPQHVAAHIALARAHMLVGEQRIAKETLQQALAENPGDTSLLVALAGLHLVRDEPRSALEVVDQARAKDRALPALRTVAAQSLAAMEQYGQAAAELQAILKDHPESRDTRVALAQVHLAAGQGEKALALYDALLQDPPLHFPALEGKCQALAQAGRLGEAVACCAGQGRLHADDPRVFDLLGRLQAQAGKARDAEASFLEASRLSPGWLVPYYRLGLLYVSSGRLDEGIARFQSALAQDPDSPGAAFLLGSLYELSGKTAEARAQYGDLLRRRPDFLPAANNLAYLIAEHETDRQALEQGLELLRKAASGNAPAELMDTYGWLQYRLGNLDQAAASLALALEKAPRHPEISYHLAVVMADKGDGEGARRLLEGVLRNNPENPLRTKAAALLEKLAPRS